MRMVDFTGASTYVAVTDNAIDIGIDKQIETNTWVRFAFSYICD